MAEVTQQPGDEAATGRAKVVAYWLEEVKGYQKAFKTWEERVDRINKRYRDERSDSATRKKRYNILWSNINTLLPALYAKPPVPQVERRFLDQDFLGRVSSLALERAIDTSMETGYFHKSMEKAVLDYLLGGRGQMWVRYEPVYGQASSLSDAEGDYSDEDQGGVDDIGQPAEGEEEVPQVTAEDSPEEEVPTVEWEKVCYDYVHWKDFAHGRGRTWEEVPWVGKRSYPTRKEGLARFGEIFLKVPLKRQKPNSSAADDKEPKAQTCAEVWEIWDKATKRVIFISPDLKSQPLEEVQDPLHLEGFWPCPEPLYATMTNDTLVPVPDFAEYQDQADELDLITARIAHLQRVLRWCGVYDSSVPALKNLLMSDADNKWVPVADWAAFSQKGGLPGGLSAFPIKDIADALLAAYTAREHTKAELAEITGLADIIRGQTDPRETLGAQRIKGQFADIRLQFRRRRVAQFALELVRIGGEVISEQFSPEILAEMTGILPQIDKMLPKPPAPPPPEEQEGMPPEQAQMAQQQMQQQMLQQRQQEIMQAWSEAIDILRDDKMRTFRIDIETDSTIEMDLIAERELVTSFVGQIGQFLAEVFPVGQQAPALIPALGQTLMFAIRRFRVSREVESALENAIEQLQQQAANPKQQPSPEQIKAQAEAEKQKMETDREQTRHQNAMAEKKADFAMEQMRHQMAMEALDREMALLDKKAAAQITSAAMKAQQPAPAVSQ